MLDALLDLEPQARRALLEELRDADGGLAAELEDLLSASGAMNATRFLEQDASQIGGGRHSAPTLIGSRAGPYLIEAWVGEGSTGSVWRARRVDDLSGGKVAIKLLHMSRVHHAGSVRFDREGAILARLQHPNIAQLLDAGITAAGQPYLVLELAEGEHLDRHCDARRLDISQRLAMFDDVLRAVEHAHSQLVIHRDIKPNNILVAPDGTVKLLDFGIAKLLEGEATPPPQADDGHAALTPHYAAPEQVTGGQITTATDVYALGVLLHALLAGELPTASDGATPIDVIHAAVENPPARLANAFGKHGARWSHSARRRAACRSTTPARLRRQLRGDLDHIVARALRKNPAERYRTVSALAEDLRRHRNHEPVGAHPDSLAYRCMKFTRRYRGLLVGALLVLAAVGAGLWGTVMQCQRIQADRGGALRSLGHVSSISDCPGA